MKCYETGRARRVVPLQGMQEGGASPAKQRLPEEGNEAGAGAEAVFGIAGEVAAEHFFFVEEAEDDERDDEEKTRQRPPGAERERRENQHENRAEVHGMADEAIGSGGNDSLALLDLNGAGGEAVLLHHPKGEERAGEDEGFGKNREPKRDARPAEAMIQAGDEDRREGNPLGPAKDGFLRADGFLGAQAALHQLGIALEEIRRGKGHGEEQQRHKRPGLPIAE